MERDLAPRDGTRIRRSFLSQAASRQPDKNRSVAIFPFFPKGRRSPAGFSLKATEGCTPVRPRQSSVGSPSYPSARTPTATFSPACAASQAPPHQASRCAFAHPSPDAVAHHSAPIRCPTFLPGHPRADPVVDAIARRTSACVSAAAAVTRRALVDWVSPRTSETPSSKRPRSPRSPRNLRGRVNPSRVTRPSESASFPGAA